MEFGWLSLLPVVLVIILAFTIKDVFISLLTGILVSGIILDIKTKSLFLGLNSIYKVFQKEYAVKSILFCLMVGSFVYVIEASGGIHGMVEYLTKKKQVVRSQKGAQLFAYLIGILMFIDGTSSIVISGVTARPLFDHFDVSRENLAYITDSTSSPVAWLVPFNGAGAFLIAMIGAQVSAGTISGDPMKIIISTIPFQLYGILSILMVGAVILLGKGKFNKNKTVNNKQADNTAIQTVYEGNYAPKVKNVLVPIILLIGLIVGIMLATGDGSTSIYIGVIITLILTGVYYVLQGVTSLKTYSEWVVKGMSNYLGVTMILALAFAFSDLISELGTGAYIASISGNINPIFIPAMVFVLGAIMSFATGTSGGTVGILIPIVFPMAVSLQVAIPVVLGAIISGGIFGDHCSPISDSTILSSMVSEVQVMDHVTTQMPYALITATISCVGFLILGAVV